MNNESNEEHKDQQYDADTESVGRISVDNIETDTEASRSYELAETLEHESINLETVSDQNY